MEQQSVHLQTVGWVRKREIISVREVGDSITVQVSGYNSRRLFGRVAPHERLTTKRTVTVAQEARQWLRQRITSIDDKIQFAVAIEVSYRSSSKTATGKCPGTPGCELAGTIVQKHKV
jgi:endonuclease YncB( thermonuclease family)